jgi:Ca-activated chloride channel family protein
MHRHTLAACALAAAVTGLAAPAPTAQEPVPAPGAVFRGGVDLVRVTATVTDRDGRFVTGLRKEDFTIYEDGVRQEIAQFTSERAPVSLGILLDTSGSMSPEKMTAARDAIDRFINTLLDREDELFFVEFADEVTLAQNWTRDRELITRAVRGTRAVGNTSLFDAIATAVPKAGTGQHRKKALLVISDGNDSHSKTTIDELQAIIRDSEVLVYALGIDAADREEPARRQPRTPQSPFPPGPRFPGIELPRFPVPSTPPIADTFPRTRSERVDGDTLRKITDDTGGLTEIVRGPAGLPRATARIADELRRQYDLGYASNRDKDGKWHVIRVEVPRRGVIVRARTGYMAGA